MPSQQPPRLPCGWVMDTRQHRRHHAILFCYKCCQGDWHDGGVGTFAHQLFHSQKRATTPLRKATLSSTSTVAPLAPRLVPLLPEPQTHALPTKASCRKRTSAEPTSDGFHLPSFLVSLISAPLGQSCPSVYRRPNVTCR